MLLETKRSYLFIETPWILTANLSAKTTRITENKMPHQGTSHVHRSWDACSMAPPPVWSHLVHPNALHFNWLKASGQRFFRQFWRILMPSCCKKKQKLCTGGCLTNQFEKIEKHFSPKCTLLISDISPCRTQGCQIPRFAPEKKQKHTLQFSTSPGYCELRFTSFDEQSKVQKKKHLVLNIIWIFVRNTSSSSSSSNNNIFYTHNPIPNSQKQSHLRNPKKQIKITSSPPTTSTYTPEN